MKAIRSMWIDGQTADGETAVSKLELRRDDAGNFRWYGQGYNESGIPSGPCDQDTEVSGENLREAMESAEMSWCGGTWNLRKKR